MLEQCIFTISLVLGRLQCIVLCPLDLSSQRIVRQQKHNGEKSQTAKEYIAIRKTQVLLQNVATAFAHHPLC